MSEMTINTNTHKKRTRQEMQKLVTDQLDKLENVGQAITKAKRNYISHKDAASVIVETCEDWINSSPNADPKQIDFHITAGNLKRSCSSGRLFIQLHHGSMF